MSCYPLAAALLLIWASVLGVGEAFSIAPRSLKNAGMSAGIARLSTKRYYYEFSGSDDNDNDNTSGSLWGSEQQVINTSTDVVQILNQQKGALARVVSAFPPTGHAFELSHIEDVLVLSVDELHMDLEVTMCEAESCAAVIVPVKFSHPCGGEGSSASSLETCVLDNFSELDQQAELLLQKAEFEALNNNQREEGHDTSYLLDHTLSQLAKEKVQYPSWWVSCSAAPDLLVTECDKLRDMFNEEEFADEIRLLAKFGLGFSSLEHVKDAVVRDIGPAGMIVQSQLQMEGTTYATVTTDGLVDIPIQFPNIASNIQELQNNALAALDEAAL